MVIDSSALLAILLVEADDSRFARAIARAGRRLMSAANLLETALVIEGTFGDPGGRALDRLVATTRIEVVSFNAAQLALAREAFRRFGKGRHPAGLNFGDCFSYALARHMGEPLLFKGNDFARTDIQPA